MKNEFKPHVFKQQNSQSQLFGDCIRIKTIVKPLAAANSIKTEHNLTSKSEANIEDLHFNSITSEKKSENLKSKSSYFIQNDFNDSNNQINDEKRPLNKIVEERELNMDGTEKNVGKISKTQIPSKYSSFTDLTKNKSLNNKEYLPKQEIVLNRDTEQQNFNYFYNSIIDYNSFNLKSYQLNSINDFNVNDHITMANDLNYVGDNYSTLNLIADRSTTTTSSVSTNSSSLSSSIGGNQIIDEMNNGRF